MDPAKKDSLVAEIATINANVEQSWKNFRILSSKIGAGAFGSNGVALEPERYQCEAEKALSVSINHGDADVSAKVGSFLASDDALLSAKAMSPNGAVQQATSHSGARQQLSTGGSTGPKFGAVESDGAP